MRVNWIRRCTNFSSVEKFFNNRLEDRCIFFLTSWVIRHKTKQSIKMRKHENSKKVYKNWNKTKAPRTGSAIRETQKRSQRHVPLRPQLLLPIHIHPNRAKLSAHISAMWTKNEVPSTPSLPLGNDSRTGRNDARGWSAYEGDERASERARRSRKSLLANLCFTFIAFSPVVCLITI